MSLKEDEIKSELPDARWLSRRRYHNCFMLFLGYFQVYMLRSNMSVAILPMTKTYNTTLTNGTQIEISDFNWDSTLKGFLLSSYFYGYIFTHIPGGVLTARFGSIWVMATGISISSIITIITPWIAQNVYALFVSRALIGLFSGVTFPCNHGIWSRWSPPDERSRLTCFAYVGMYVGTVFMMALGGVIAVYLDWSWIFILPGISGLIWTFFWLIFVNKSPAVDRFITKTELIYIESKIGRIKEGKEIHHPWKSFFLSTPCWANTVALFAMNWGLYTLLTYLPTFFNDILKFDEKETDLLSALPYILMTFSMMSFAQVSDFLIAKKILSIRKVRRLVVIISCFGQILFGLLIFAMSNPYVIAVFLSIFMAFNAAAWPGFSVNWLDIAPPHASVLMGLSNTLGTVPGIVSPLLTGYLVQDKLMEEWFIVFGIISGWCAFSAIFYFIFVSGKIQPWVIQSETI